MARTHGVFVWYELMTSDVATAKAFYATVVGWRVEDVPMPGATYTVLSAGETQVGGLMDLPADACAGGVTPCWAGYLAVDDVDAAARRATELGGAVHRAPADIPGIGRFAVIADPCGAALNVFRAARPGQPAASRGAGHVGWRDLHSTDWPTAFGFYSALFGWGKGSGFDTGATGAYQQFTIAGTVAGGMFNSPAALRRSLWLYHFSIGDIDAATARVVAGGGEVIDGPRAVPGGGWITQATDPQGTAFALLGVRN
jgi:hypothetical protein